MSQHLTRCAKHHSNAFKEALHARCHHAMLLHYVRFVHSECVWLSPSLYSFALW